MADLRIREQSPGEAAAILRQLRQAGYTVRVQFCGKAEGGDLSEVVVTICEQGQSAMVPMASATVTAAPEAGPRLTLVYDSDRCASD